jgi:periplasmic protein TonB
MATILAPDTVPERTRLYPAAALALIVEALLLGGTLAWLSHEPPKRAEPPVTVLALTRAPDPAPAPAPVQPPKPPEPKPIVHAPVPVHHVARVVPPRPVPRPPAPVQAPVVPASPPSASPTEAPSAPPPPPSPPPPPAAAAAPAAPPASFEGELRAAIQAALRYPESARMAGMSGRTRVGFRYRDGLASDVTVLVSSGSDLLDRAAVAAVRDAAYPKPAPAFVGKTLPEQIWVTFNLDSQE